MQCDILLIVLVINMVVSDIYMPVSPVSFLYIPSGVHRAIDLCMFLSSVFPQVMMTVRNGGSGATVAPHAGKASTQGHGSVK